MTDVYVYRFTMRDRVSGEVYSPKYRATLAAIRHIGEPIMESQIVADRTEVDADGFLRADATGGSHLATDLSIEIKSLQLRADSRDSTASALDATTDGVDKYMLQLESRELRNQARKLQEGRDPQPRDEAAEAADAAAFARFRSASKAR